MSRQVRYHWGSDPAHLEEIPGVGVIRAAGTAVPADAVTGYAPGCIFHHYDGSGSSAVLYANVGTKDSANFDVLQVQNYTFQVATRAKVGGTAGWTVAAADNLPYIGTVAASQTGAKLVLPIDGLHIGDTITGFKVNAQIESAGNAVTLDAALRATTNVAAEPTDAEIGAITQVSVTADTLVASSKTGLTEVVTSGKTYYLLFTATTAAATDIILQACEVSIAR